ncbi:glycosyl hydrolase 108 family protein [Ancylobacter sp. TS-1]|uniref:glycosyl hydrolase 108 family protein n=1 Tax=Ancylobacter sp. TS-1 TaxID=1850374 RepID=UPI001265D2D9|nr:glycosyl hydrolase 108 family protein [Ancylobacter sp. TS-1]QFR32817.1 hypothetical protein GBB76_06580 [Ancylobacter sp. TS-1]
MNPFVVLAGTLLPEILKLTLGPKSAPIAEAVTKAVQQATGTTSPEQAQEQLAADPKLANELRLELARIAAQGEEARRQAELEELRLTIERESRAAAEAMAHRERDDKDREGARGMFLALASARNPLAWAPVVISVAVVGGFFWILWALIQPVPAGVTSPFANDGPLLQIINIVIGGLVSAFATVVSYHLGSSASSRAKDTASFQMQERLADQTGEAIRGQRAGPGGARPGGDGGRPAAPEPVKAAKFQRCADIVLVHEGGFVNHPKDPGGATNLGITLATLAEWRGTEVSVDDVRNLTPEEAREIYRVRYWNPLNCDALPPGVDLVVYDFGVNAGPVRSAKMLQKLVGAKEDGAVGPATLAAVATRAPADIVRAFSERRLDYYRSLGTWETFGKGWTNRTVAVEKEAVRMAGDVKQAA